MMVKQLKLGFSFIFRGMKLLFEIPGALKWAIFPFLINLALIAGTITFVMSEMPGWIGAGVSFLLGDPTGFFYGLLYKALLFLASLLSVVLTFYIGFLLSTIIAAPFNSILAEKTLDHCNSQSVKAMGFKDWLRITMKQLGVSLIRALLFAIVGLMIFIFSFIPLLNLIGAFVAFLIVAFDCIDYSMEIKLMTLKERLTYFRQHFSVFTGMAIMLGLTLMVPGLTLLLLPCAIIGAAEVMAKIEKGL